MTFQTSALILSWVAIALLALVVSGLVRQVHALSADPARGLRQVGLPAGAPAPGFGRLAPERPATLVLLFLDHDCRTCTEVLDEATRAVARPAAPARNAVTATPAPPRGAVTGTPAPVDGGAPGAVGPGDVVLRALYAGDVPDRASSAPIAVLGDEAELFDRYDAIVRPFAVVVDPAGRVVGSEPVGSRAALRALLARVGGHPAAAPRTPDPSSPRGGTP